MICEAPACVRAAAAESDALPAARGFVQVVDGAGALSLVAGVAAAAFADIGDKGSLDVLLNVVGNASAPSAVVTLFNNLEKFPSFVYLTSRSAARQALRTGADRRRLASAQQRRLPVLVRHVAALCRAGAERRLARRQLVSHSLRDARQCARVAHCRCAVKPSALVFFFSPYVGGCRLSVAQRR